MPENRFNGNGPVTLGGAALGDLVSWEFKPEPKLDELEHLTSAVTERVHVNGGWTATLKLEYNYTPRGLSAIQIGSWTGANVSEWSFDAEGKVEECTGPMDLWQVYQLTRMDWALSATKWQSTADWKVFLAMLQAQIANGSAVSIRTPYGNGQGLLGPLTLGADGKPAKAALDIKPGGSTFTTSDALVGLIKTAADQVLAQGYADPVAITLAYNQSRALGSGLVYPTKVSYKGPVGKVTCDVEVRGTGAFTFAS